MFTIMLRFIPGAFGGMLLLNLLDWLSLSKKILFLAFQNVPKFLFLKFYVILF